MAPGEQIAFQPALTHVLAQDLHHPPVRRQMLINRKERLHPYLICRLIYSVKSSQRALCAVAILARAAALIVRRSWNPSNRFSFEDAGWPSTHPLGFTNDTAGRSPFL